MIRIKDCVPGSGASWFVKDVAEREHWLQENVQISTYRYGWLDISSNTMFIDFENEEDAMAYKLRWK